jgi:polyferredoxin
MRGLVFGTLLGPEATGPGVFPLGLFVSGFPAVTFRAPVWVCGVCGVGLLFENYIVDASILYKKQFPRLMNLDLAALLMPFGCWGVVGFCGSLEKCF